MDELVSRQMVIDGLEFVIEHGIETDGAHSISAEKVLEFVRELPPIQSEPHWIPIADGLPNIREDVLVSYYDEVMAGWLNDDGTWFAEGYGRLNMNDIAAWQPLPESYKGENA